MIRKHIFNSLLTVLVIWGCSKNKTPDEPKPIPIHVTRSFSKDVPYYISTVGHMEAYEIVNIMAQVNGQLLKTYFTEGSDVKQGDLLYLVDQRPYITNLERAEGDLEENLAKLKFTKRNAERNAKLVKDEYISQNDYDNLMTNVIAGDAAVKQSRANVDNAKINLDYTMIYAPLDARAGESKIHDGNLILESAGTTLVTLNKISPIYSVFHINEKDLPTVQRYQEQSKNLKVLVTVENIETPTYEGVLIFIDNRIDTLTGMIKLKGTHPNTDKILWPNQYVKVKLILDMIEHAVIVPFEAVQTGPIEKYLYVVKGNKTVEKRNISVGQMQDNNMIVIKKGLKSGEKVVTVGQLNLYPGAKVTVKQNEEEE